MSSLAGVGPTRGWWRGSRLHPVEIDWEPDAAVLAADSWFVTDGRVRGLELHRERFFAACLSPRPRAETDPTPAADPAAEIDPESGTDPTPAPDPADMPDPAQLAEFWTAMVAALPLEGEWFPKVELLVPVTSPAAVLTFSLRTAPVRTRSLTVTTHLGADPRTVPTVKGPDLRTLGTIRADANDRLGAEETIILSPEGYLVEGAYSALAWWQQDELCVPPTGFARIDSITAKSLVALAGALGVSVREESVRPGDLAERELWALSALHGIRIVTNWIGGPPLAERPGRLATWRTRLDRLAHPITTPVR